MILRSVAPPADFQADPALLRDRVVFVTGATGDIGQALCPELARLGATVILAGRQIPKLEQLYDRLLECGGPEPVIYPVDLAGAALGDYDDLRDKLASMLSRLDGLVHLAAEFQGLSPFQQTRPDHWMAALQVGVNAPFLLSQALLPLLARSDAARIVMALDDPVACSRAYWGGYGVAKAGLEALVGMLSDELEAGPVEVSAVRPPPLKGRHRARFTMAGELEHLASPEVVVPAFLYLLDRDRPAMDGCVIDFQQVE